MGAVCSGGTRNRSVNHEGNNLGFSGKLKTTRSLGKTKEKSYPNSNGYNSAKTHNAYDLDERRLSYSSELKPSTPATTGVTKVRGRLGLDVVSDFVGGISQQIIFFVAFG